MMTIFGVASLVTLLCGAASDLERMDLQVTQTGDKPVEVIVHQPSAWRPQRCLAPVTSGRPCTLQLHPGEATVETISPQGRTLRTVHLPVTAGAYKLRIIDHESAT